MSGVFARRRVLCALAALAATLLLSSDALALEAFDGRIQVHGFGEMQLRGLSKSFEEEVDLAQWYNVLNVELEFDIAPDGWGPFDLLSAFVRIEGRYDCIYSSGCGAFPSVRTWGDKSRDLPLRLRNARDDSVGGDILTNEFEVPTGRPFLHSDREPFGWFATQFEKLPVNTTLPSGQPRTRSLQGSYNPDLDDPSVAATGGSVCPVNNRPFTCPDNREFDNDTVDRKAFPGFDTLFRLEGADGEVGPYTDFNQPEMPPSNVIRAPLGSGPTVPATIITTDEGQRDFQALTFEIDDPAYYTLRPVIDWKFVARDQHASRGGGRTKLMGPWLPKNTFKTLATLSDRANPFRGRTAANQFPRADINDGLGGTLTDRTRDPNIRFHDLDATLGIIPSDLPYAVDTVDPRLLIFNQLLSPGSLFAMADATAAPYGLDNFGGAGDSHFFNTSFGGDFSGIIACFESQKFANARNNPNTWQNDVKQKSGFLRRRSCIPFTNIQVTGGKGELPFRPAADVQNLAQLDKTLAQGQYLPSAGLVNYLENEDLDPHDFNISEIDRSFNHGQSQQSTYELKEAYLDMEFFDSRLWIRAGKQNIVWGKTELFRTTDQFNPQDLALANLPSLEESRIGLLSARAVWSFYDVGPLEDLRFELAANFDSYQPADLGACGEPFAFDVVCQLTLGLALHGLLGVGIVGIDRPPSAWNDVDGIEYGGRIEFRWDRFSFAITDFYGYHDTPSIRPVGFYERNVDPDTGRPRAWGETGRCENAAGFLETVDGANIAWNATNWRLWQLGAGDVTAGQSGSGTSGASSPVPPNPANPFWADDYSRNPFAVTLNGVGIDPACLKPGGAANQAAQNGLDVLLVGNTADFPGAYNVPGGDITGLTLGQLDTASFITNLLGSVPAQMGVDGAALNGPWNIAPGQPVDTDGDGFPDQFGASPQNALQYNPANLQLFTILCSATVGIASSLDPGSCAWNIFGTEALLNPVAAPIALSEVLTTIFAGETDSVVMSFMITIQNNTRGAGNAVTRTPLTPLNLDAFDGRSTAFNININPTRDLDQAFDEGCVVNPVPPPADPVGCIFGFNPFGFPIFGVVAGQSGEDLLTMDRTLTAEQRALLGCGPFYGTRCDSSVAWGIYPEGGGIDVLNAEASVILQSFPGIEGSDFLGTGWTTTSALAQPGTIGFANRVAGTRYSPASPLADELGLVTLPGNRGAIGIEINNGENTFDVEFQAGYNPLQDGCTFGVAIAGRNIRAVFDVDVAAEDRVEDEATQDLLRDHCNLNSLSRFTPGGLQDEPKTSPPFPPDTSVANLPYASKTVQFNFARTLWHPLAACDQLGNSFGLNPIISDVTNMTRIFDQRDGSCRFDLRSFEAEFITGGAQIFRNEMAAWSWNFMQFLIETSCNSESGGDDIQDPDCFNPTLRIISETTGLRIFDIDDATESEIETALKISGAWSNERCSLAKPYLCRNVKGFLGVAGVGRNAPRAGGSRLFGRRDFIWHSGGELVLRYARRNVFGFSADFAEDYTKTNWGMEFTYFGDMPFQDSDSGNNVSDSGTLNLTISVDRPTFINFLNANRTFFFNSQWFFSYLTDYENGFTTNGPLNVLFTFAVFTGYFQDRLLPTMVTVYDFKSRSGGFLPSVAYRFTEAFSVTIGSSFFIGHRQLVKMPINGFAPNTNRVGDHKYKDPSEQLLTNFMNRDEVFLRLRWTF